MISLRNPFVLFLILATTIIIISYLVVSSRSFLLNPDVLSMASSIDIVVLIPAVYFFSIRKTKISKITVIPVFILSLLLAKQIIPENYQETLKYIQYVIPLIELFVIGSLIYHVINISKAVGAKKHDLQNFPEIIKEVVLTRSKNKYLANILASESSLFYYAFAGWSKPKPLANNEFSYYRKSGYISVFYLVLFIVPIETFVLHFWLSSYSSVLAWALTFLSIYGLFFILGDKNSIRHRPIVVSENAVQIKTGLRWCIDLPYISIDKIEQREGDSTTEKLVNLSTFGFGNVVITLKEGVDLLAIYGIKKNTQVIALSLDEPEAFISQIRKKVITA